MLNFIKKNQLKGEWSKNLKFKRPKMYTYIYESLVHSNFIKKFNH